MRRLRAALAGVGLLVVAACGGEPSVDDYCARLTEDRARLSEIVGSGDPAELLGNVALFDELRDEAPRDLRDEWDTLVAALQGLRTALDEAGVDPGDFQDGEPPDSLSGTERRAVVEAAGRIADPDVVAAASGIETQARDVCKINLGL
ncbi:hypothetical protein [Nocardioides marmoraquaticus]